MKEKTKQGLTYKSLLSNLDKQLKLQQEQRSR